RPLKLPRPLHDALPISSYPKKTGSPSVVHVEWNSSFPKTPTLLSSSPVSKAPPFRSRTPSKVSRPSQMATWTMFPNRPSTTWAVLMMLNANGQEFRRKRSEEHTSELQSRFDVVCRLLLDNKKYANQPALKDRATPVRRDT